MMESPQPINVLQACPGSKITHSNPEVITYQEGALGLWRYRRLKLPLIARNQLSKIVAAKLRPFAMIDHGNRIDDLVTVSVLIAVTFFNNWKELSTDDIANVVMQVSTWPNRY